MTSSVPNEIPFETAFNQLEQAVQTLEKGGLSLDQALVVYEEGMRLAQVCSQRLDKAELKITQLQNAFSLNEAPQGANGHDHR